MAIVRERPFEIADPTIFPASASELHGLGGPLDELYGARKFDQFLVLEGGFGPGLGWLGDLAAACPEGSSPKYTGERVPGTDCFCAPGRVVRNGYCQSPESVVQQESASLRDYAAMSVEQQMAQELSSYARQFIGQTGHSVSCKLVYPSTVPGGPNYPTRMCSIDGSPYDYGAYAINLNPMAALNDFARQAAVDQVAQKAGVAPGAVYSIEGGEAAVTSAVIQQQKGIVQSIIDSLKPAASTAAAASSSGAGQTWADETVPVPPPGAGSDSAVAGPIGWNTGGSQYEVFGVDVPQVVTDQWIGGIPNWLLLVLVLGGGYLVLKQ